MKFIKFQTVGTVTITIRYINNKVNTKEGTDV